MIIQNVELGHIGLESSSSRGCANAHKATKRIPSRKNQTGSWSCEIEGW